VARILAGMESPRLLPLALSSLLLACGGSSKPAASANEGDSVLETPETRCLAIARGARQGKRNEPDRITVKHVLVQFEGSKNAKPEIKRSRGDACLRALEARAQLQGGEPFASVVSTYSDERGAATREGSVGSVTRKDVVPPFADAAFELDRGEVSHVVETDFGYHIILRVE
jgi:peptidyl-prolyl cis-trans isomerase NIMA-interacting 1